MQTLRYLPDVTTLKLNQDACIGCTTCATVCPHRVFVMQNGKAHIIDRDGCMECGACALNCPADAISLMPGVGCAAYIIQKWLGKGKETCC